MNEWLSEKSNIIWGAIFFTLNLSSKACWVPLPTRTVPWGCGSVPSSPRALPLLQVFPVVKRDGNNLKL